MVLERLKRKIDAPHITLEEEKRRFIEKMERLFIITENPDDGMTQPTGKSGIELLWRNCKKHRI